MGDSSHMQDFDEKLLSLSVSEAMAMICKMWKKPKKGEHMMSGSHQHHEHELRGRVSGFIKEELMADKDLLMVCRSRLKEIKKHRESWNRKVTAKEKTMGEREGDVMEEYENITAGVHQLRIVEEEEDVSEAGMITALMEASQSIHGIGVKESKKNHNTTRFTVADILGIGSNITNSNTPRQTTNSLGHPEWAMSLLRRLMAHTVTYENHIRPHLERLHSHCSEMSPTSFRKEMDIVDFYARHAGALQPVFEVHPRAADKFRVDLLGLMNLIRPGPSEPAPGHWQPLRTSQLQIMSQELREHIPWLSMPNDMNCNSANFMRQKYKHLRDQYIHIHGAICEYAFHENTYRQGVYDADGDMNSMLELFDILGGDNELCHKVQYCAGVAGIAKWARDVRTAIRSEEKPLSLRIDMGLIARIVSVLQELFRMFPQHAPASTLKVLKSILAKHIEKEFPNAAIEPNDSLRQIEAFSKHEQCLEVIEIMLQSPSPHLQTLGLKALASFMEGLSMNSYRMHQGKIKQRIEETTELQKSRLGSAFVHVLRPYDRPDDTEDSSTGAERNFSLGHLGPLPTGKGYLVQRQLDRKPIESGIHPLVVLVSVSGSGKSELLEQLSRHHFHHNGGLSDNQAELLLPLDLNDLDVHPNSVYLRGVLERATLSHILAVLTIATAIIRGHKKDTKLPASTVKLPSPHDLFLFFKNGGGTIVKNLAGSLPSFSRSVRVNVVRRCRSILLDELKIENANVSFAVDEVNKVAEQHMNSVWKSSDKNIPTGSAMTAVSHALQHIGTTVYAGTGLRYGLIEEAVSAVGKEIVIMAPSLPATSFRMVVFVLNRLLNFRNCLCSNPLPAQCIEIPMLIGRMRFLEMFMRDLIDRSGLNDVPLSDHPHPTSVFC